MHRCYSLFTILYYTRDKSTVKIGYISFTWDWEHNTSHTSCHATTFTFICLYIYSISGIFHHVHMPSFKVSSINALFLILLLKEHNAATTPFTFLSTQFLNTHSSLAI